MTSFAERFGAQNDTDYKRPSLSLAQALRTIVEASDVKPTRIGLNGLWISFLKYDDPRERANLIEKLGDAALDYGHAYNVVERGPQIDFIVTMTKERTNRMALATKLAIVAGAEL